MKITIEDTNAETDDKQKGVAECEKDSVSLDKALHMVTKSLMAYGYREQDVRQWFIGLARMYDEDDQAGEE